MPTLSSTQSVVEPAARPLAIDPLVPYAAISVPAGFPKLQAAGSRLYTTGILIAAALTSLFAGCASAPPEHLFSELHSGDRIHVHFRSVGCYHNVAYTFDFERGARTTVRIKSLGRAWSPITPNFNTQPPHLLGTLTLSGRDIRGLDNLVQFYRAHPDGFCSTADYITFKYPTYRDNHGDAVIVTERYTDLSCDTFRLPGLTTFPSLARRLER